MTPDEFISLVCHDLRAPVRGLRTLPEWMREEVINLHGDVPAGLEDVLGMMEKQANRLDYIIADLSAYSKLSRAEDDPSCLLADAMPPHDMVAQFTTDLRVDRIPMEQKHLGAVLQALMDNALKHGNGLETRPHLSVAELEGTCEIVVRDYGAGFDTNFARVVFEPLRSLKSRDMCEGSGMGLAVVARIAALYDGQCWVTPNKDHNGTEAGFRLRLNKVP